MLIDKQQCDDVGFVHGPPQTGGSRSLTTCSVTQAFRRPKGNLWPDSPGSEPYDSLEIEVGRGRTCPLVQARRYVLNT
jgi:hypothetical protein